MDDYGSPHNLSILEQAWLGALQQQCDRVDRPPVDRPATQNEINAFFAGLNELERYCNATQATADQFTALGRPVLSQRLAAVLDDIRGARKAFNAPSTGEPGPISTRMYALRAEQQEVAELSARALQLIVSQPAQALPQLANALLRSERNFIEQEELLQRALPWGPREIPALRDARLEAKLQIRFGQGVAAAALGKFDVARGYHDAATAEMGALTSQARLRVESSRVTLAMMLEHAGSFGGWNFPNG